MMMSYMGARTGRIDWVKRGGMANRFTCITAAAGGHLPLLKWLGEVGCPCTCAATKLEGECPWHHIDGVSESLCTAAALGGHIVTLKWLRKQGCQWDFGNYRTATGRGSRTVASGHWINIRKKKIPEKSACVRSSREKIPIHTQFWARDIFFPAKFRSSIKKSL